MKHIPVESFFLAVGIPASSAIFLTSGLVKCPIGNNTSLNCPTGTCARK